MKVIILTAGFGAGHNSAARALHEEFVSRGHESRLEDGLALVPSRSYARTRSFYDFCVNRAGWLWGLTYDQTDRADWSRLVSSSLFRANLAALQQLIEEIRPDLLVCTYPLFSFMLDVIQGQTEISFRHVAVVTDALEVSRPWLRSKAERIFMTDEHSAQRVMNRYVLGEDQLVVSSFPTSSRFFPSVQLDSPSRLNLRILYSAQAPASQCLEELSSLLSTYPMLQLTVIAGKRYDYLQAKLAAHPCFVRCQLVKRSEHMDALMRSHHLYIGKPGGATMFECYASALPMIVNFALMGQEQGNLELLERDSCGCYTKGAPAMVEALNRILAQDAKEWKIMRANMLRLPRRHGARRVCESCIELVNRSV